MDNYLKTFREMISLRGLADHTIKSYSSYLKAYLDYLQHTLNKAPEEVSWEELRQYIFYIQQQRSLADRTINGHISQLRFFTIYVLHKPWDSYQLPHRKFDTFLPYVPSREEVWKFISSMSNLKYKTMVALMYSAGLRIGEVCHLKYQDIERKNKRIQINKSKNRAGRYALLSEKMLQLLTEYWLAYSKPRGWLFPRPRDLTKPMYTQTLSRHFNQHRFANHFNEKLTCHSLKHGFGTHLYEDGVDLLTIKTLLGHKSINTTTIYISLAISEVSSVTSPFDTMGGEVDEPK